MKISQRRFVQASALGGAGLALVRAVHRAAAQAADRPGGPCATVCNHWSYIGIGRQPGVESNVLPVMDASEMADRPPADRRPPARQGLPLHRFKPYAAFSFPQDERPGLRVVGRRSPGQPGQRSARHRAAINASNRDGPSGPEDRAGRPTPCPTHFSHSTMEDSHLQTRLTSFSRIGGCPIVRMRRQMQHFPRMVHQKA